jgi:hypothetical protein
MAVNAVAPFVLCTLLQPLLTPPAHRYRPGPGPSPPHHPLDGARSHVVNVTALEGKFNVGKKSGGHPHTNMAKVWPIYLGPLSRPLSTPLSRPLSSPLSRPLSSFLGPYLASYLGPYLNAHSNMAQV